MIYATAKGRIEIGDLVVWETDECTGSMFVKAWKPQKKETPHSYTEIMKSNMDERCQAGMKIAKELILNG